MFPLEHFAKLAPEMALAGTAAAILLLEPVLRRRRRDLAPLLALAGLALAGGMAALAGPAGTLFGGSFVRDEFTRFFELCAILAGGVATLHGASWQRAVDFRRPEYYALLLLVLAAVPIAAGARDVIVLAIAIETLAIASYALLGIWVPNEKSREAMMKAFVLGSLSTALLLFGLSFVYGATGATRYPGIALALAAGAGEDPLLHVGILLAVAGIGFRLLVFPFSMFAADAFQGAPAASSAAVSTAPVLAGFGAAMRMSQELGLSGLSLDWQPVLATIAALSIVLGNLVAVYQDNVKRMMAYSTVAHAGYLFLGLAASQAAGVSEAVRRDALGAVLAYLVAFVLMQVGAFVMVSSVFFGQRFGEYLPEFRGLGRRCPFVGIAFLLILLSLAGLPPTFGFFARAQVFTVALEAEMYGLVIVGAAGTLIGLFYYLRVAAVMYFRADPNLPLVIPSVALHAAIAVVATAVLALGLFPAKVLERVLESVRALF